LRAVRLEHGAVLVLPEHARIVVQNVEGSEATGPLVHHALDVLLESHVAHRGEGVAARLLDEGHRLLRRLLVDVADDEPGALLREQHGGLAPHAHARAGDERHLVLEPCPHTLSLLSFLPPTLPAPPPGARESRGPLPSGEKAG